MSVTKHITKLSQLSVCGACALAMATPSYGQTVLAEGTSVVSRARPDYDAAGLNLGGFSAFPSLAVATGYNDNIFNRQAPKVGDGLYSIEPQLSVRSNWSRNSLSADVDARFNRFYSDSINNNESYRGTANGEYEVTQDFRILGAGRYERTTEPRGSYGDIFESGDPVRYSNAFGSVSILNTFNRLSTRLVGTVSHYDYLPVNVLGQRISLKYRNFRSLTGTGRVSYSIGPRLQAFVEGAYNDGQYTVPVVGAPDRDSHGYQVLSGAAFGLTELLYAEVGLGYLKQLYDNPLYRTSKGFSYTATIHWNPTALISLSANLNRSVQRAPLIDTPSVILSGGTATVDYELLRNLILHFTGSYRTATYKNEDRRDHLFTGSAGAKYLVNRLVDLTLTYNYRNQRSSGIFARRYTGNSVLAGIVFHR